MRRKIKVLQVISSLKMGGAEKIAYNLYKYSDKNKYEVSYLVYDNQGEFIDILKDEPVKIISISKPSLFSLYSYYKKLVKIMKDTGPYDIVHAHNFTNNGFVLAAANRAEVPVRISHSHTNYQKERNPFRFAYSYFMRKLILRYSNSYVACSMQAGESLYGAEIFKRKGVVLKNSIDVTEYTFNESKRQHERAKLRLGKDELMIVQVGRLSKEKNQSLSIDVLNQLLLVRPESKLYLVGDGPDRTLLEDKIARNDLNERVILLGNRGDVASLLQAADVFLMPSLFEGIPLALVEAQCISLPCIISTSISNDAILGNKTCKVPLTHNAKDWADTVMKNTGAIRTKPDKVIIKGYDIRQNIVEFMEKHYAL